MSRKEWTEKVQLETLITAKRLGLGYTSAELELVVECSDLPVAEVAQALGRSYYAIQSLRAAIAEGRPVGSDRDVAPVRQAPTYTYIDGDCPPE